MGSAREDFTAGGHDHDTFLQSEESEKWVVEERWMALESENCLMPTANDLEQIT